MKYSDHRETIFKGLARLLEEKRTPDTPLPVATPRLIADPKHLAFRPATNRALRRRVRRVRFKMPAFEKPWSAA